MAFKPVRLTDPKGKLDDVIATHPVDMNNFIARDGYVQSEDQSGLEEDLAEVKQNTASTVAGLRTLEQTGMKQAEVDAANAESSNDGEVASEKAAASTSTSRQAAPAPKTGTKSGTEGKATDAGGNTVQTA
ncbi:putative major tail protein [Nocardia phage NC1]|nr:putative major tail protein [Nocardia phage NC1]QSL67738.1 hypothetical protein [Nocardia phage P69]